MKLKLDLRQAKSAELLNGPSLKGLWKRSDGLPPRLLAQSRGGSWSSSSNNSRQASREVRGRRGEARGLGSFWCFGSSRVQHSLPCGWLGPDSRRKIAARDLFCKGDGEAAIVAGVSCIRPCTLTTGSYLAVRPRRKIFVCVRRRTQYAFSRPRRVSRGIGRAVLPPCRWSACSEDCENTLP